MRRRPALWQFVLGSLLLLAANALAQALLPVPPLTARVTDLAGMLTPRERTQIEAQLKDFETDRGSQVAVLIVGSTVPETIEQYAIRVAENWKLGRAGIDDGALLLVAKDDRAVRIEVGYGLEGVLPDAIAKRIVSEIIVPAFREGHFAAGIQAGVVQILRTIEGEPLPPPAREAPGMTSRDDPGSGMTSGVVTGVFTGMVLRSIFGRLLGALAAGGIAALVGWLVSGSVFVAFLVALFVFFFTAGAGGGRGGWSTGGPYRRGGFGRGGLPGGFGRGGFGGGGGGGGFRGGGGGFGGGGASGRW